MKPLNFGYPTRGRELEWVMNCLRQIEQASQEEPERHADAIAVTVDTESRTLDTATATAQDVARAFGTFIADQQKRGAFRAE